MVDKAIEQIIEIAESVVKPLGLCLVDARLGQQGRKRSLEVTIFRSGGPVGLADCEKVSRQLEEMLDRQVPPLIDGPFLLEVQSPGIDRQLKTEREFAVFTGQAVEVKAREEIVGLGTVFAGTLKARSTDHLTIAQPRAILPLRPGRAKAKPGAVHDLSQAAVGMEELEIELTKLVSVRLLVEDKH